MHTLTARRGERKRNWMRNNIYVTNLSQTKNGRLASLPSSELIYGGGGEDRTPDLGVMNPTL
jgi:hypothetical protein